jgi:hypothetical protein
MLRSVSEVFSEPVALGTPADQIWPELTMPFRRIDSPIRAGVTRERHGAIRAVVKSYDVNERIV